MFGEPLGYGFNMISWDVRKASVNGWAVCIALTMVLCVGGCATETDPAPSEPDTAQAETVDVSGTLPPGLWIDLENCRPVEHVWNPETEPLMLPCEPTKEECDGVDNDEDGITDPKCPTMLCESDADCTYGGLVADADCNGWGENSGECNHIDGVGESLSCRGMLCPPQLKCIASDCVVPGNTPPLAPCTSGADCPIYAGCIPLAEFHAVETAVCKYFCHDFPCPEGFKCWTQPFRQPGTDIVTLHSECVELDPDDIP
jgi:hypothetical protein